MRICCFFEQGKKGWISRVEGKEKNSPKKLYVEDPIIKGNITWLVQSLNFSVSESSAIWHFSSLMGSKEEATI